MVRLRAIPLLAMASAWFAAAQNLSVQDIQKLPRPAADHRVAYGSDPLQFGDLRLPAGSGPHPVVIVIHGGCWLSAYDLQHLSSFCAALTRAGMATWSLEYRRVGDPGGGWPGTLQDVSRGADHLRELAPRHRLDLNRVVAAGHSAGGHLALWLAARRRLCADSPLRAVDPIRLRGVVSLAGVPDLRRAAEQRICGDTLHRLLGGSPAAEPERYRQASPIELLPLGLPQRLIHGALDKIVPVALARDYEAAAKKRGDDVRLVVLDQAAHFEPVAPESSAWPVVEQAVRSLLAIERLAVESAPDGEEVSGVVLDPSRAAIVGARVSLEAGDANPPRLAATDLEGRFRFPRVAAGDYRLQVEQEGFQTASLRISVAKRRPAPLRIVLPIAQLKERVTINNPTGSASVEPSENLDSLRLDRQALENVPVLGQDIVGAIAQFLDPSSLGTGGVTLVVDGLETREKGVAVTAIQEVRINQNPYSAEFSRPGHGRIEIITTPGSTEYHGTWQFLFRDHRLDARNAFAVRKQQEQRRVLAGHITGPLGRGRKDTFLLSLTREEADAQALIYARSLAGDIRQNFPNQARDTELSARWNRQVGDSNTFSLRYEWIDETTRGRGVGGFQLPESASDSTDREQHIYYNHRSLLRPRLLNELYFRGGRHDAHLRSRNPGLRRIVVLDAFTGGGAQADRRDTENHVQINDTLSFTAGRHLVKAGINVPDFSRRGSNDRANFDGVFSFSSLEDFAGGRPFAFQIQQGESHLAFWQKEIGVFFQDDVRLRSNLSLAFGLRWDWQNYLSDRNNFSPRFSFAYSPDQRRRTVLRGGAGSFYDRTGPGAVAEVRRLDGRRLRQLVLSNPSYPNPFASPGAITTLPSNIARFAPDLRSPYTIQYSLGVERQLAKSTTATVNYRRGRGIKLFRSRNVNAPRGPLFQRPDPSIGILRQVESSAGRKAQSLELALRGELSRYFNGTIQFHTGRVYNDTDGLQYFPADNYDLSGEWAPADYEGRQHLNLLGTLKPGKRFQLGIGLGFHSGRPYTLTSGRDDNRDTFATDRPAGARRHGLDGPGAATLDLRWSREFYLRPRQKEKGPAVTVGIDAFNVLNRVNYAGYVGNLSSPFFGRPVAARPARRVQLTSRLKF